jgi:uncharacterized NAD-dependent epimerase/dehydratase family protein
MPSRKRILILAEGHFSPRNSKTANCVIRYRRKEVAGVWDSTCSKCFAGDVLGFGGRIPVVSTLRRALALRPTEALVGVAPRGGRLEKTWLRMLEALLLHGVNVVSGLHDYLGDLPALRRAAEKSGARIRDLRKWEAPAGIPPPRPPKWRARVILTVGSDCNVGKMTATWELVRGLQELGCMARAVATGQTGIYLAGSGIPADAIKSDFLAGAAQKAVCMADAKNPDYIVVEGQGALHHPAYSAVSLGLLHGSRPDLLVLCHRSGRQAVAGYPSFRMPPLKTLVRWNETAASMVKPARVGALCLNTSGLSDSAARRCIRSASASTGLPAFDPIRFGRRAFAEAVRLAMPEKGKA